MAVTEWSPYHALRLDPHSDSFVVVLNEAGPGCCGRGATGGGVCPQCSATSTEELSVKDIAHVEGT